jgi:hypothetical protein
MKRPPSGARRGSTSRIRKPNQASHAPIGFYAAQGRRLRSWSLPSRLTNPADRLSRFITVETCHLPPRAVRTPWPVNASAIAAKVVAPLARMEATTGISGEGLGLVLGRRRPIAPATKMLVRLPSVTPCVFRTAKAAAVPCEISCRSFSAAAA